jgi:hypothetical protein
LVFPHFSDRTAGALSFVDFGTFEAESLPAKDWLLVTPVAESTLLGRSSILCFCWQTLCRFSTIANSYYQTFLGHKNNP